MNAISADDEEDRYASRAPRDREGQVTEEDVQVKSTGGPVELMHADPRDLAAVEVSHEQGRNSPPCIDCDVLVAGIDDADPGVDRAR
jgi:hypothetical protein